MPTLLKNILDFTALAPAGTAVLVHGLSYEGDPQQPDTASFDVGGMGVVAADATTITVINNGTGPATGRCFVEKFHSYDRAVADPDPFASGPFALGGGAGGTLPPLAGTLNAVLRENPIGAISWGQLTPDDLGAAFTVDLAIVGGTTFEVGVAVVDPSFTASYGGDSPAAATLDDNGVSAPVPLISPFTAGQIIQTYNSLAGAAGNNNAQQFGITADSVGGVTGKTDSLSIAWRPRVWWGARVAGVYDQAFILGLSDNALAASRARTITNYNAPAASGFYLYYAIPSSYGTPIFTVNGFAGGFNLAAAGVSVDNGVGYTPIYDLWESDNIDLGTPTVVVT